MAVVRCASRKGRTIVERKGFPSFRELDLSLESTDLLPSPQDFLLLFGKVDGHRAQRRRGTTPSLYQGVH